jgi:hypothetical protein
MNGDAPALMKARRLMIRGQVGCKSVEVAQLSIRTLVFFARFRFVEAYLVQSFSLLLKAGKGTHKNVYETVCR